MAKDKKYTPEEIARMMEEMSKGSKHIKSVLEDLGTSFSMFAKEYSQAFSLTAATTDRFSKLIIKDLDKVSKTGFKAFSNDMKLTVDGMSKIIKGFTFDTKKEISDAAKDISQSQINFANELKKVGTDEYDFKEFEKINDSLEITMKSLRTSYRESYAALGENHASTLEILGLLEESEKTWKAINGDIGNAGNQSRGFVKRLDEIQIRHVAINNNMAKWGESIEKSFKPLDKANETLAKIPLAGKLIQEVFKPDIIKDTFMDKFKKASGDAAMAGEKTLGFWKTVEVGVSSTFSGIVSGMKSALSPANLMVGAFTGIIMAVEHIVKIFSKLSYSVVCNNILDWFKLYGIIGLFCYYLHNEHIKCYYSK